MNLILKGYWSNNPIPIDEVIQNPELVLRVPVGMVTISADVDKAYVDEQYSLLGDQLLAAIGKLQAQINNIAPPTWVSAASIGTIRPVFANVQFAKIGGLLWIRGYCRYSTSTSEGTRLFSLTDPSYHLDIPPTSGLPTVLGEIKVFNKADGTSKLIQLKNVFNAANEFTLHNSTNFTANEYNQIQPVALGRLLTP